MVDYQLLINSIIGTEVPKPISGTLSGHAAGEPFDKLVHELVKAEYPTQTFRQYEYLNHLFSKNLNVTGQAARAALFNSPTLLFLLSRGKNQMDKWSANNLFEEKQNDTADILVVDENHFEIIDIKTRNVNKSAQAPNIISAFKLAQVCTKMIDNEEFDSFSLNYIEVDWKLDSDKLTCTKAHFAQLFLANPASLYINWAAAMQIQFHVCDLEQGFTGGQKEWAIQFIRHFVTQAKIRAGYMITNYVLPFEKYLI